MTSRNPYAAPDELVQLVRPFVGTYREVHRGDGSRLDVLHAMNSVDADVRAVDAAGLTLSRDGFARFVPWTDVRSITVRGLDADGVTVGATVWRNAAARFPVRDGAEMVAVAKGQRQFGRAA